MFFACATICPDCDSRLHPVCQCGEYWQSDADWDTTTLVEGGRFHRPLPERCLPVLPQREAHA